MMNRDYQLIKGDWKMIGRDPMLMLSMFSPLILLLFARLGFPLISDLTKELFNFPLEAYFPVGCLFLFPLIPMLFGLVYGFIMLDERDGGIISYLVITPLGKSGYFLIRMFIPICLSIIMCIFFLELTGFYRLLSSIEIIVLSVIVSSEAPIVLLFLGAYADNKVEGIAMSKGFGILIMPILIDYFLTGGWRWLMAVSPLWWAERAVFSIQSERWLYMAGAAIVHSIFLYLLYRKFEKRFG
jgi:fluoroquinolone transport system permease protein